VSKFQFRKRSKLAPGLSLNISKRGLGLSAGPKGLKLSASAGGRLTGSAGIPGSGVSFRGTLNSQKNHELDESTDNSFLASVIENSAYISIHGPVFTKKEIRRALLLLATSTICLVVFILTAFGALGLKFNPFLYLYIGFTVSYIRESSKNKKLERFRKIEHLKNCSHLEGN